MRFEIMGDRSWCSSTPTNPGEEFGIYLYQPGGRQRIKLTGDPEILRTLFLGASYGAEREVKRREDRTWPYTLEQAEGKRS